MKKIKNVIIINDFNYTQGGASKVSIDTANLLVDKFEKVYFFSCSKEKSKELNQNVIDVYTGQGEALNDSNKVRGIVNGLYNVRAKKELKKLLSKLNRNETIIHIHGWTKCLSSSIFDIVFKEKFKIVLTLHDYFTSCPNGGFFNYNNYKICELKPMSYNCIRCNCDSRNYAFKVYRILRQFIQNKIVKLPLKLKYAISISEVNEKILKDIFNKDLKIMRIYNPFDSIKVNNINPVANEYYLFVGRVSKEKGADIFCEAMTKASKKGIVVGDGPELNLLKEKYKNIIFTGWLDAKEMSKYYEKARAVIVPSRWYEGASLIPMEASKYNIPCITVATCAAKEFVPKENIYKNFEDLVDKIKNDKFSFEVKKFENKYFENLIKFYNQIICMED